MDFFLQDFSQQSRIMGCTSVTMTPQPSHSHGSNSAAEINEVTSLSSLLTTEAATIVGTGSISGGGGVSGGTVTNSGNHFLPVTEVVYSKREGVIGDCSNINSNKSSNINNKSNNNNSNNHHTSGNNPNDEKLTINAPLLPKNDKILEHNNIGNK